MTRYLREAFLKTYTPWRIWQRCLNGLKKNHYVLLQDLDMYGHLQILTCQILTPDITVFLINDQIYVIVLQLGAKFLKENGFKHVRLLSADGALESFPPVRFELLSFKISFCFFVILPFCSLYFFHLFIWNVDDTIRQDIHLCVTIVFKMPSFHRIIRSSLFSEARTGGIICCLAV